MNVSMTRKPGEVNELHGLCTS